MKLPWYMKEECRTEGNEIFMNITFNKLWIYLQVLKVVFILIKNKLWRE